MRKTMGLLVLALALAMSAPVGATVRVRLEAVRAEAILGWAFDPAAPTTRVPVRLRILCGGREVDARECVADIANAGREQLFAGTGGHWFRVVFDPRRWDSEEVFVELATRARTDGGAWVVRQVARLATAGSRTTSIGRLRLEARPGSSSVRAYAEVLPGFEPGTDYWIEVAGEGTPAATRPVATPEDGFDHPAALEATLPAPRGPSASVAVWSRARDGAAERRLVGAALVNVVEAR